MNRIRYGCVVLLGSFCLALAGNVRAADDPEAQIKAAKALLKTKNFEACRVLLDTLLNNHPNHAYALGLRGFCQENLGSVKEAIQDYQRGITVVDNMKRPSVTDRGVADRCRAGLKRIDPARKVIADQVEALVAAGEKLKRGDNPTAAKQLAQSILRVDPGNEEAVALLEKKSRSTHSRRRRRDNSDWKIMVEEYRWHLKDLDSFDKELQGGVLTVSNHQKEEANAELSYGRWQDTGQGTSVWVSVPVKQPHSSLMCGTKLIGDFELSLEVKGGEWVGLYAAETSDDLLTVRLSRAPEKNKNDGYVVVNVRRSDDKVTFKLNGKTVRPNVEGTGKRDIPFYFGIRVPQGKTCSIRNFSLDGETE